MELSQLLNFPELAVQIVNFVLLVVILRVVMWKPVLQFLQDRRARIAAEVSQIEKTKQDLETLNTQYEARLAVIDQTAQQRLQNAAAEGKALAEEIRKTAQAQAQAIIDQARTSVTHEIAAAKHALQGEIVDLAIRAAEKVIAEKLSPDQDRRLVQEFLDGVDKQ